MKRVLAICAAALVLLAGCGMRTNGAKEYVQAALDAEYKGSFEKYMEITDASEDEARAMYEKNIEAAVSSLGFGDGEMSDELSEKYTELVKEIFAKEKYTVGEAKKTEDGFDVEVTTQRMALFDDVEDDLMDVMKEKVEVYDGQPDEEEVNRIALESLHDLLKKRIKEPEYDAEQTVTVHVAKDKDGVWTISENDLKELDGTLLE